MKKFKLPRLSDPTIVRVDDTEITMASPFDLMTTREQWVVLSIAICFVIMVGVIVFLQYKGILK